MTFIKHCGGLFLWLVLLLPASSSAQTPPAIPTLTSEDTVAILPEESVTAEEEPILIATTDIYDPQIVDSNESSVSISFDINNQVGAQPGVKYAVNLMQTVDGNLQLIDQHVYNEVLSIREGQTIKRTITYDAPGYLSGEYSLWLIAKNERDFPLSVVPVPGTVTFIGTEPYASIKTSDCHLTVDQDR